MGLIKLKRSQVALNCSTMGEVSPVDYAARVIVELFPIVKTLKKDEDAASFSELIPLLEQVSAASKRHRYSKEALLALIKEECLQGKSVFDLCEIIGNSAFCFFPTEEGGAMTFKQVSKNPPPLRSDYGDEPYAPSIKESVNAGEQKNKPVALETIKKEKPAIQRAPLKKDLSSIPEIIALKKKYNELEKRQEKYYWQWRVSTKDYEDYKGLLQKVDFSDRTTEKVRLCAPQLAFYAAEWYKREYDGNETENCFTELGITSAHNKEIWDITFPKTTAYRTEETDRNLWLYSMFVLGGFPIKYTLRSNRFSSLFDEIWGEDQNQDLISEEQLDEITLGFAGNQVVKSSLVSGSLHDYYRYLRIETTMPIANSDRDKEPFVSFIRHLQEGKKKYYEQYLKPTWLLYVDNRDSFVNGEVQVSFGRREDKCYIPIECLSHWAIPDARTLNEFEIDVSDTISGEKRSIRFSKTGPDNYPFVGWSRINKITLPFSLEEGSNVEIHLIANAKPFKIGKAFSFGDSRQFYKTKQPYEWSSRTDNNVQTAILFNPARLILSDSSFRPQEKSFRDGGRVWNWLVLTEEVSLVSEDSDVPIQYSPRNSSLEIVFSLLPNTIKYVNFRDVIYNQIIDGEQVSTAVTLLRGKHFVVKYTPFGSNKAETIPLIKCIVSYKRPGDNRFIPWDDDNPPRQGYMQLRVVYKEKGVSSTRMVYHLPQSIPIRRITKEHLILFGQSLENVCAPKVEGYAPIESAADGYYRYYDDLVNGYLPQADTIPFLLGNPDGDHVIINVYRSAECKELYLKGEKDPIKRYDQGDGYVDIPVILRRNFEVRTINSSGVSRVKCGGDVYMRFDAPNNAFWQNYYIDAENGLRYYSVMNSRTILNENDSSVSFVLETSPAQYRFYYWSMNAGEEPVLLNQNSYDPETKYLTIDISPLKKNNRGVVFQSLKGVTPRHFFGPLYGDQTIPLYGRQRYMVSCFDVASEHNIPFFIFPCFKELFSKTDIPFYLAQFWVELMNSRDWKPSSRDYLNLHRFAYEFLFDWIMLPKIKWSKYAREWRNNMLEERGDDYKRMASEAFKSIMLRLFRTSPYTYKDDRGYLERIMERYWAFRPQDGWPFRRNQRPENLLAQCIRGNQGDYSCFNTDYDTRLSVLKRLHECKSLYEGLFRIMAAQQ